MARCVRVACAKSKRVPKVAILAVPLRKALEFIPNSVRLWKEAVSLEESHRRNVNGGESRSIGESAMRQ